MSICSSFGFWSLFIFCSLFVIANANIHQDEDEGEGEDAARIDPHDLINYDPTTKCMRNPAMVKRPLNHLAIY